MDTMTIKTKFMKSIVSKLIGKLIKDQTGIACQVNLEDFRLTFAEDEKANVRLAVDIEADAKDVGMFLSKGLGL